MIGDVLNIMVKEWKELLLARGNVRGGWLGRRLRPKRRGHDAKQQPGVDAGTQPHQTPPYFFFGLNASSTCLLMDL